MIADHQTVYFSFLCQARLVPFRRNFYAANGYNQRKNSNKIFQHSRFCSTQNYNLTYCYFFRFIRLVYLLFALICLNFAVFNIEFHQGNLVNCLKKNSKAKTVEVSQQLLYFSMKKSLFHVFSRSISLTSQINLLETSWKQKYKKHEEAANFLFLLFHSLWGSSFSSQFSFLMKYLSIMYLPSLYFCSG